MQATATTIARPPLRGRESVERSTLENSQITTNPRLRVVGRLASDSGSWLFTILVLAVLYIGWSGRSEGHITAESGLGYAFGIVGGSFILLLLLYPLRKRMLYMRRWFPVRHWFRLHMIFGVLGPVMILLHSNFRLGSTNSSVALVSMLLVATSGLIGRFFYTKIHYGLYGSRANLEELKLSSKVGILRVRFLLAYSPTLTSRLQSFHEAALISAVNPIHGFLRVIFMGFWTRWTYLSLLPRISHALDREAERRGWKAKLRKKQDRVVKRQLSNYLATVRKVVELNFYERVFSLWHVVHLPLFLMLLISGIVHVVAVHMY